MAVTAAQAGPVGVNLPGITCGPFRSVSPPRGPAAGQAGKQMAPSLPQHTRGNQGISRSGRVGRRLRRRRRRSTALDALPVVLLAVIAGAGPFSHIRDTAEHGQHKPTPRTSTEKEANTARPDRSGRRCARAPSEQDLRAWRQRWLPRCRR